MRATFTLLTFRTLILSTVAAPVAYAALLGGDGPVAEVTVYPDRAYVRRKQTIKLPPGAHSIAFDGITPLADMSTLRVQLSPRKSLTLMGMRHEERRTLRGPDAGTEKLRSLQRELEEKRGRLYGQAQILVRENENLRQLEDHYRDSFTVNLHQNVWNRNQFRDFVKFVATRATKMNGTWFKLFQEFVAVDRQLTNVRAQLQGTDPASDRKTRTVVVEAIADGPVTATVELQYLVTQVGWSPLYDLRIDGFEGKGPEGKATLELGAHVWQRSGEDWNGVKLTLSNQRSELKVEPPTITRNILSYREADKVQTEIRSRQDDATKLGGSEGEDEDEEASGMARTFVIPGPQTVKTRPAATRVAIDARPVSYREQLEVVPGLFAHVYRKGTLVNAYPFDLGAGPMNVFYRGEFLHRTRLEPVGRGARFGVNVGVDANVRVTRGHDDKSEAAGLLGGKRQVTRVFRTKLENFSSEAKRVRLLDQVPVSELESVKVSLESNLGEGTTDEDTDGWYSWSVTVPPRAEKVVENKVTVVTPKEIPFAF